MTESNQSREYFMKLPDSYNKDHPYRLIYTLHALRGNAGPVVAGTGGSLSWYGIPPLAIGNIIAIYVAPNGLKKWMGKHGS
ncbi:hypothetical protein V8E51_012893 [Hyaloscypha variabilis]